MFESRQATIPFLSRLNDYYYDEKKGSYGLQYLDAYSYGATRVDDSLPRKEKDLGSFTLPCYINNVFFENTLAYLGASVSVMPLSTYLNLDVDPLYGDYIKLNDLNVPLELRRDQVDDLMPIIEEVVENMDGYRDQDMGDVIFGEPFCKASCVEARRSSLYRKSTYVGKYRSSRI
ncbi:hypothetical protein Tco_0989529 [Tanacetum coccineum]|uniref:Uncharacterized protein n=1 Tax=Tanacetum coccineum TaxID=301880 RepID=A0ABQ5EU22_9ASTR